MEKDHTDNETYASEVRLAFRVSYLGSRFYGSQMQASSRTAEGEFVAACRRLDLFSDARKARFLSAGRTDRGVHARGQVFAFTTRSPERAITALNFQLPPDLWVTGCAEVAEVFHPRYDAKSRTYRYYFSVMPSDPAAMNRASHHFLGNHNFRNFARVQDKNPNRAILDAHVGADEGFVYLEVKAESFLWHQVRCMASALLHVGNGEAGEESIALLLQGSAEKPLQPAPAEGLVLWDTDCGILWTPVVMGKRSTVFLDHLIQHYALMKKVCRTIRCHEF
jgi:tRNA pseudouridine38-40 synthase